MTLDQLEKSPEYLSLGDQQRKFVTAYCTNGADKIAAAQAAYPKSQDRKVAAAIASRNLAHVTIKKLTAEFFELPLDTGDKEQALAMIWKRIQGSADDKVFLGLMNIYGKWKGFEVAKPAAPEPPAPEPEDLSDVENILRG